MFLFNKTIITNSKCSSRKDLTRVASVLKQTTAYNEIFSLFLVRPVFNFYLQYA